jgi:ABC-type antimicrobial peptide transport system permease subunit
MLGFVIFLGLRKSFSSFLYGVSSTDPTTLVLVSLSLTIIALVAAYMPARRPMKLDPAAVLNRQ